MIAIFPEIAGCAASGDIEKLSILARVYFGEEGARSPRIDVKSLLQNAGVSVKGSGLPYYAAVVAKDDKGQFEISTVYREDLIEEEVRFNLAHCLGHILLDIEPKVALSGAVKMGFKEEQAPIDRYCGASLEFNMPADLLKKENRADSFAAALLLPKAMLLKAIEKIGDLDLVAKFFKVTKACLERRLVEIGARESEPSSFLEAERKIKGRVEDIRTVAQPVQKAPQVSNMEAMSQPSTQGAGLPNHSVTKEASSTLGSRAKTLQPDERRVFQANQNAQMMSKRTPDGKPGISRIRELARQIDKSVPN